MLSTQAGAPAGRDNPGLAAARAVGRTHAYAREHAGVRAPNPGRERLGPTSASSAVHSASSGPTVAPCSSRAADSRDSSSCAESAGVGADGGQVRSLAATRRHCQAARGTTGACHKAAHWDPWRGAAAARAHLERLARPAQLRDARRELCLPRCDRGAQLLQVVCAARSGVARGRCAAGQRCLSAGRGARGHVAGCGSGCCGLPLVMCRRGAACCCSMQTSANMVQCTGHAALTVSGAPSTASVRASTNASASSAASSCARSGALGRVTPDAAGPPKRSVILHMLPAVQLSTQPQDNLPIRSHLLGGLVRR